MMTKKTLFSISTALALTVSAQATTVSLSAGFTGPFIENSDGSRVNGGLMLLGTITDAAVAGLNTGSDIASIMAVFQEFGTRNTSATGGLAGSVTNVSAAADAFNGQQIYLWVLNTGDKGTATEHALLTVADKANPSAGDDWVFPTNAGGVGDGNAIAMSALIAGRNQLLPGGTNGNNLRLVLVPEPSGAMLAGLAGLALMFRRRR